jgi:hypothetical protein
MLSCSEIWITAARSGCESGISPEGRIGAHCFRSFKGDRHEQIHASFDISTAEVSEQSQPGRQFYGIQNFNHGRVMIFVGGVPLRRNVLVIGAIGVSGGSGNQDQAVAKAGASAATDPRSQ